MQVVNALSKKDAHVPFRQTKLTSVLRDALGGNCRTLMLANVWKDDQFLEEAVSTLRFAARVSTLQTEPVINESTDPDFVIRRYERLIRELKQELDMRDSLVGRPRVNYQDLTEAEALELQGKAQRFLDNDLEVSDLPVDSLKRVRDTFIAFRQCYTALKADMEAKVAAARAGEARVPADVPGRQGAHGPTAAFLFRSFSP